LTIAWIAVGVVLIAVQLHQLAFYALFAARGCFAGAAVASVAPGAIAVQVVTAVVVAAVGILLVRGRVRGRLSAALCPPLRGGPCARRARGLGRAGRSDARHRRGLDRVGHVRPPVSAGMP
jgi:hypothetical protein